MARNAGQHKGGQLANETSFPERCAAKTIQQYKQRQSMNVAAGK